MRKRAVVALAAAGLLAAVVPAGSALASPGGTGGPLTIAVYGDSPYGTAAYSPGGQAGDTAELPPRRICGTSTARPRLI